MLYKAIVKDKQTKELIIIESEAEVFNYIMDNTNCNKWDWEENN